MSRTDWEVVIGLEIHAQLNTASKIFSGASTAFGAEPNRQASAVDIALPGTLPVLNRGAVERAMRFGLAIGAHVAEKSVFARKNYFYPDLPKGYQISQMDLPVVQGGEITIRVGDAAGGENQAYDKSVRLTSAQAPGQVIEGTVEQVKPTVSETSRAAPAAGSASPRTGRRRRSARCCCRRPACRPRAGAGDAIRCRHTAGSPPVGP